MPRKAFCRVYISAFLVIMTLMTVLMCLAAPVNAAVEPSVKAGAALLYCENTGEEVFSKDPDKRYQPYSVAKLMTALVAVSKSPLDKKVTVSKEAASQIGSTAGFSEGEKVTLEELLYGALLESGNDAAYSIAETVSGSKKKFVKQMNKMAKNLGCRDTKFTNPSGLVEGESYTTCNDLLKITRVALGNKTISKICSTKHYVMRATNKSTARELSSNVFELLEDGSVYAGKNGYLSDASCTTSFEYRKNGLRLFVIILGDTKQGRTEDAEAMVKYAEDTIEGILAVKGNKEAGKVRIKHGAKTSLDCYTESDGYAYIPHEGSKELVKTEFEIDGDINAPVKAGLKVGKCRILVGSEQVNEVPLVIKEDVGEGWITSYIGISNRLALVLGIVLGALLLFFILVVILRTYNKIKRKRARKRRIREIAEQEMREEEEHRKRGWDM